MQFDGTVDADGNVYWSECHGTGFDCDIVSVTRDGDFRWRQQAHRSIDGPLLITSGLVIVGRIGAPCGRDFGIPVFGVLQAFRTTDGAPTWTRDLVGAVAEPWWPGVACVKGFVWPPTVQASRTALVASLNVKDTGDFPQVSGTIAVDAHTGDVLNTEKLIGPSIQTDTSRVLADPHGSLHFIVHPCAFVQVLHGIGAAGAEQYSVTEGVPDHAGSRPIAVTDRYLFDVRATGDRQGVATRRILRWRRISDGIVTGSLVLVADDVTAVVSVGESAVVLGTVLKDTILVGLDLATAKPKWLRTVVSADPSDSSPLVVSAPILTDSGSVVYTAQSASCIYDGACGALASTLVEVAADGREVFRGALPAGVEYSTGHALDRGRWFVGGQDVGSRDAIVRAFDVPGRTPAEHGWVAQQGNMACDNAAR